MALIAIILLSALTSHPTHCSHLNVGIVNGREAKPHSRPYMVSLQNSNGDHICGGFLVSGEFVMTAAHCYDPKKNLTAVVGAHDLKDSDSFRIPVINYTVHPDYKKEPVECLSNDIMLLRLKSSVNQSKNVNWIPITDEDVTVSICSVAGWGKQTTNGHPSNLLMEADVHIVGSGVCKTQWVQCYDEKSKLCAGGHAHGFCKGDSGGPLVCNGIAVGISSFYRKDNCETPTKPNVYTKIFNFLSWIKSIMHNVK